MQLEIYQQETEKLAKKHQSILLEIKGQIEANDELSLIEEQAMLHSIQVVIENAIGKARHLLKMHYKKVPVSGYDLFEDLKANGFINQQDLNQWKKVIGLRNTIVHEYMKVDLELLKKVILEKQYKFVIQFLNAPFDQFVAKSK
ncbi:MAG: DUF86 domain-containing protein [Gammaproteobacteria bacterium]|nr:DUF86 domain-containing protein [Gammaproteobacteria bacterium]